MKITIDDVELWARRNNFTIVADEWWNDAQDIICKYRKIEQIIDHYKNNVRDKVTNENMEKILEVIEHG